MSDDGETVTLLEELDYALPESAIAQAPLAERDAARLLSLSRRSGEVQHQVVRDLPRLLQDSLLVLNDTRVFRARLRGQKESGGRAELLLLEASGEPQRSAAEGRRLERWRALGTANKPLKPGQCVVVDGGNVRATIVERRAGGELFVDVETEDGVVAALEVHGEVPLPPYIRRTPGEADAERYQTVYARSSGAVAAPTAGLHFSPRLFSELAGAGNELAYVTLHVGPGTFSPVKVERLDDHAMHSERYEVPEQTAAAIERARREKRPVVAVGTTVVRTLEAVAAEHGAVVPTFGSTRLFIRPPYEFRAIDALFTNFHLPKSTLLALVMAFGGVATVRAAYLEAVREGYRFFSYGDAMLIR